MLLVWQFSPFSDTALFLAKSHLFPTRMIGQLYFILSLMISILLTAYENEEGSTTENTTMTASIRGGFLTSCKSHCFLLITSSWSNALFKGEMNIADLKKKNVPSNNDIFQKNVLFMCTTNCLWSEIIFNKNHRSKAVIWNGE